MNQIAPQRSNYGPPAPASTELARKIAGISNCVGWFGGVPKLIDCEVGPVTQGELRRRLAQIDAALGQRDPQRLKDVLYQIFALTKINRADGEGVDDLVLVYAAFLGTLPIWAVIAACDAIAKSGEKFAPAAPEIHAKATQIIAGLTRERQTIADILRAVQGSEPRRAPPDMGQRKAQVEAALAALGIRREQPEFVSGLAAREVGADQG